MVDSRGMRFYCALWLLQELDEMKKRLKEMEEEAAALREMQAKVEKEMGAVQGFPPISNYLNTICLINFRMKLL